jgi:hypothetical protein
MRTILLMSVDSASGWGNGPGSINVTRWPRRRSSSAAVTPNTPPPTTRIRIMTLIVALILTPGALPR